MGRTNIVLDDRLVKQGLQATGLHTKRELIDFALRELLQHEDQVQLLKLRGNVRWEGNLSKWRKSRVFK